MAASVANVGENSIKPVGVKVAPAHRDDGAEAAIKGTTAGGFNYVHLPAEHRIASKHAGVAVRQPYVAIIETVDGSIWVAMKTTTASIS